MKRIIVAVILVGLAGQASATVGSIISSFKIGATTILAWPGGIYRDSSYVYCMAKYETIVYLAIYYPYGKWYRDRELLYPIGYDDVPLDMTGCHLGAGYFAFTVSGSGQPIYFATLSSGSIVQSFIPGGFSDIMWDGLYYHVGSGSGAYDRYTTAGTPAGQWTVAGWPAGMSGWGSTCSDYFNNAAGRYLFVGSTRDRLHYVFNMNDGSLLASWPVLHNYWRGQNYGDAYPTSYGGALWYHGYILTQTPHENWAYQLDVDRRNATNVVPASVGKIKAIYR